MSIIEHDYGDDSHCRVCNAYGPNEDHILCTANIRATQPDRAAIEALARELADEQWLDIMCDAECAWTMDERAALLAYLDETWAGLFGSEREVMKWAAHVLEDGADPRHDRPHFNGAGKIGLTLGCLLERGLIDNEGFTPRGRAVLRRAKEMKR